MRASDNLRDAASHELAEKVTSYLHLAQQVVDNFQTEIKHEIFNPKDPIVLETFLFDTILTNITLSEISLTFGDKIGYDADGDILLAPTGRGEMTLYRKQDQASAVIDTRYIYQKMGQWVSQVRARSAENDLFGTPFSEAQTKIIDPTTGLTFTTPANRQFTEKSLWSDLHWSQIDQDIPENMRNVEVSLQRTVTDAKGNFLGVLRVGLFENQIERITKFTLMTQDLIDPYIIFITDRSGELITRLNFQDTLRLVDGNLRFSSTHAPPQVQLSLKDPVLNLVSESSPLHSSQFDYRGDTYLVTYRQIEESQDWILGIVVPQSYYVGPLESIRNRLLLIAGIIIICLGIGGFFLQHVLKREQKKIIVEAVKMENLDFKPFEPRSIFNDIYEILSSLEQAKTAMRAMSKYIPIELVKQLYQSNKEPVLGGKIEEISILFTDICNFTSIAEKIPVNDLAQALGKYLKVMTQAIQNDGQGIIDKYIGDGIMALWNTPTAVSNHAELACRAVLDCTKKLEELFASTQWQHLPRFDTRFGLHKDQVMVGHFGAPDRLNFTALGNGVNIASRLQDLNKQYGTSILVSKTIFEATQKNFVFRLIDFIVLKGKTDGIKIYELIGEKGEKPQLDPIISKYEEAFDVYQKRHFANAMDLLKDQLNDGPSMALYNRSAFFLQNPPPDSWNGIYIFTIKG